MRPFLLFVCAVVAAVTVGSNARADVLSRIFGAAERSGTKITARAGASLDHAAQYVRSKTPVLGTTTLAAAAGDEGHWTFVNAAGERYTAGTSAELGRVVSVLAPNSADQLRLVITRETLFRDPAMFRDLPKGTALEVHLGDSTHVVELSRSIAPLVSLRSNLLLSASDRAAFEEAVWHLSRPLSRADIRLIALEPGGPTSLAAVPRRDPGTGGAVTDKLDPRALGSLTSVRGQTLLVAGRIDQDRLIYRAPAGSDIAVPLAQLRSAAAAADVSLVVLSSSGTRQPGARNWLWQQVSVSGLDKALSHPTMADALASMVGRQTMTVSPRLTDGGRMQLMFTRRESATLLPTQPWIDMLGVALTEITGDLAVKGLEADVLTSARQSELDARLIPWLPSAVQYAYLASFVAGLLGLPLARAWFRRLWPREARTDYGSGMGFAMARAIRLAVFALAFMPAVAIAAVPLSLARGAWDQIAGLARLVTWPVRAARRGFAPR